MSFTIMTYYDFNEPKAFIKFTFAATQQKIAKYFIFTILIRNAMK